jgi:uroporphyrinogen-III synthase
MAAALMRVLLTRPREDSERLAAILCQMGHGAIVSPLMEIRFVAGEPLDLTGVQAILASSANGIRALALRTSLRDIPVYAIGPQSAAEARVLGFTSVKDAQRDSVTLAEAVVRWTNPDSGILLHSTGNIHMPNLSVALSTQRFRVRTEILYEAIEMFIFTEEAGALLRVQAIDAVMLFSPRSAKLFSTAVERADLQDSMTSLRAICISAATAEPLPSLGLQAVAVAVSPNQDSMVALLETCT